MGLINRVPLAEPQPLVVNIQQPPGVLIDRRLPIFSGFVHSDRPIGPLRFVLNGMEQNYVQRHDVADAKPSAYAAVTAVWRFQCDVTAIMSPDQGALHLEVFLDKTLVERRFYRCDFRHDCADAPITYILHIPKTAGTSLRRALERQAGAIRVLGLYDEPPFLDQKQAKTFSTHALDDTEVVIGHFQHGMHRLSPRPFRYIGMIREPAGFLKSYYLHQKFGYPEGRLTAFPSIDSAIAGSQDPLFDNCFVRFFSGYDGPAPVGPEQFDRAIEAIEKDFAFVGTAEALADSMETLSGYFGVQLEALSENVTPKTPESASIDVGALAERHAACIRHDQMLYEFVRRTFAPTYRSRTLPTPGGTTWSIAPASPGR